MGAAVLGVGLGATPAFAQPPAPTLTVGVAGPACPGATFPSITAAVAAAAPGSTIAVCAGVYPGTVDVAKSLTFTGAKKGVDARTGRTDVAAESVLDAGGATGFRVAAGVSGVTIDGFTIRNAGTPAANGDGIDAFNGGSGFTFVNNIITQTTYGVNMNSTGATPSVVAHNRFVANGRGGIGAGVFLCCGATHDLAITDNLFTGHAGDQAAAVNTAGDPNTLSTGLSVERNQSIDDSTFAVVVNARGAVVANNQILRSTAAAPPAGSAILVGGNTDGVAVRGNSIVGGEATGIRVSNDFGGANTGLVVANNQVVKRQNGIRFSNQTSGTITGNSVVGGSLAGITLDATNRGVTVSGNQVAGNRTGDCVDATTAIPPVTANTWTGNVGLTSTPRGLCSVF